MTLKRGQACRTLVNPLTVFGLCQRIDVQDSFPFGIVGAIAFHRRATDQPARIVLVLPEIVESIRTDRNHRDAILAIEDFEDFGLDLVEARIHGHVGQRAVAFIADPFERFIAAGFFEPDERVLLYTGQCRCRCLGLSLFVLRVYR